MDNNKLSVKEKIGYGMGDAGCNIIFGAIMLFVNYFYTDIFGLAPALVGVLLLSIRVIDAVTDPIMGALADRTQSKYGRFRPWLLWIAVPYALFSILMFTTPDWSYSSKVVYAFVTYFLLSLTYTAINIPYCSLGGVITSDPKERVACQSYRFVMVGIATLLLSLTLLPMAEWFGGEDKAKGYQMAMTVLAFIGMCMFLFCFATVRERIRPAVPSHDDMKKDMKDVWKNDSVGTHSAAYPVQRLSGLYPYGGNYVLRHLGNGAKYPFRHHFHQPWRCGHDDRQYVGESADRPLVQTQSLLLDQYRVSRFLLRLLFPEPASDGDHRGPLLPAEYPPSDPFSVALVADG